jgi:serine/threonine protein kinase
MTNVLSSLSPNSKSLSPERPFQKKQNKLGPYNLLQTLGEGEFGKVKLGINTETGQEVTFQRIWLYFFVLT